MKRSAVGLCLPTFLAIAFLSLVWAEGESKPPAPPKGDAKAGKAIFDKNCLACHGKDGIGNKGLSIRPFSDPDAIKAHPTADKWVKAITDGVKGKKITMPAYKGKLKPAEIDNVAAYTWQFRTPKKIEPKT